MISNKQKKLLDKTMENLATIHKGDKVTLDPNCWEGRNNNGVVYEVLSDPFKCGGTWCVKIEHHGTFDMCFLDKVKQ